MLNKIKKLFQKQSTDISKIHEVTSTSNNMLSIEVDNMYTIYIESLSIDKNNNVQFSMLNDPGLPAYVTNEYVSQILLNIINDMHNNDTGEH